MKTTLMVLTIALAGCVNPFAEKKEIKKEIVKMSKPKLNIFNKSVKELEALALSNGNKPKLVNKIKRRIYFLIKREESREELRIAIELEGLKAELKRLKALRDRYPFNSWERRQVNKTIRPIIIAIMKFNIDNPKVKSVNRKPTSYKPAHPAKLKLAIREVKREIRILTVQFNQATGVHKIRLGLEIKQLNKQLSILNK